MSADWQALHRFLQGQMGRVTLSWVRLDEIVGGLPASATTHRAWWFGDRPHVNAWKSAGFRLETLQVGRSVTFVPDAGRDAGAHHDSGRSAPAVTASSQGSDVLLVTCVKTKQTIPCAAKDLYVSPLFVKERAYAEASGRPWFILSAEHGLIAPDEWLAPYERFLPDTPPGYREAWGRWVVARLELLTGPLRGRSVEVHASDDYVRPISLPLHEAGAHLITPLAGLSMGERLQWYGSQGAPVDRPRQSEQPAQRDETTEDVAALVEGFVDVLSHGTNAVTVPALLASDRAALHRPGLYSWWVDAEGAQALGRALSHPIAEGLIYAGQAGATRWPSGRPSGNTLWARLVGMHLGKKHEFSTFRRTLAALLAPDDGSGAVDEVALTSWMTDHLRVIAAPIVDPDLLGEVEHAVLLRLDPPLNLKGLPSSPVRTELKRARQPLASRKRS